MKYENLPWLVLFLPLLSAAVITLFTLRSKNVSSLISIGAVVAGSIAQCSLNCEGNSTTSVGTLKPFSP